MSFIGEAIATAAVEALFNKLASTELLQFARRENIHADLKKWEKILVKIHAVLDDAEDKQVKNRSVQIWLSELKNLAYDVEDILDEFATEALQRKLEDQSPASTSKVQKLIPAWFTALSPRSIKSSNQMASKIKEITTRLEEITTQKDMLNLIENSGGSRPYRIGYRRWLEPSVNEPHIYGREEDKEAILEFLLKDESTDVNFSVISIVGMGGMGKTTLARLAYNDVKVEAFFYVKVWACVSDDFDVIGVTKTILQSVAPETCDFDNLDKLQVALQKELSGKKFLIVLDDVWNENYDAWTLLCRPFQACSSGSKILLTSRNLSVSLVVGALQTYQLNKLLNDDCLSVFTQHSLGKIDFGEHQDLQEIGRKIIEKCDGLPLAAKTLGGLLRGKVSYKDWKDVLDSKIWNLPEEKSDIIPALRVSYHYLPPHLKRCFVYCSIFPKDYEFSMEDIILLWMAEGFFQTDCSEKQKEDLGKEYFEDLHSRSFFQQSSNNTSSFVMHDLIHDLAQWAAKDICFRIEDLQKGEKQWKISEHHRHLSFLIGNSSNYGSVKKSGIFNEMKSVRTFIVLSPYYLLRDDSDFLLRMLLQLRCLRVLSLYRYPISKLPNSIGDMKLLHHLDLSESAINFLPDSINKLYNLEALILKGCYPLERLCSDMGNLIKLRHLNVSNSHQLEAMPLQIGKLTSLRTLPRFVVGKDMRPGLRELKDLTHLQERLHISGLENVNDFRDAEMANLNGKEGLKDIQLEWTRPSNEIQIETQVLEKLQPCQTLKSLEIRGYGGTRFPPWLGNTSLSSLVSLTFDDCKNCVFLPSIGQLPSLKNLLIRNMAEIKSLGHDFHSGSGYSTSPSQSPEEFNIRNLQEFPRLQQLSIIECPKLLGKLPEYLPSLENLDIYNCEQLTVTVPIVKKDCTVEISKCKEVVLRSIEDGSLMSSMVHFLPGISSRMLLVEGFRKGFSKQIVQYVEQPLFLTIRYDSKALKYLNIDFDSFMIGEDEEELQQQELPCRYQYLSLKDCKCPVKLEQALQSLTFLRGISIRYSPEIFSFGEASLPSQLRFMVIHNCKALQSLPTSWMHSSNTSLEKLSITECDSLTCIARAQLPPNLKRLEIKHCSNLLTVLDEEQVSGTSCLQHLIIKWCPSLTSLCSKRDVLPDTLGKIKISCCSNLATLASRGNLPKALRYLSIKECSKLESIAKSFHDNKKLEKLYIWNCEKLETLPTGINNVISLKKLAVRNCPAMVSIPEGGFPSSLTFLGIGDANICKSLLEWGLHRLMSLEALGIGGCPEVMSFPQAETGIILPTSLTTLAIRDFPNLERLSSIAQNLTSLEKLFLLNCPKLKYFPDDGLPKSLKQLEIEICPLLEERCKKGEGLYWPMIAHISDILI